jgi:hypothetical protein
VKDGHACEVRGTARVRPESSRYGDDGWRWIEIAIPGGQTRLLLTRRANSEPSTEPCMRFSKVRTHIASGNVVFHAPMPQSR